MNMRPLKPTLAAVLACGLLLAGCQKKADTTAAPSTSPAATSPAMPATPASGAASSPP